MFYKECRPTKLKKRPNYALFILGFKQLSVISYQLSVISYQLSGVRSQESGDYFYLFSPVHNS
ncbi:MAG: hypothetical protein EWV81_13915 [Microcystis aeruginosa Ma_SC_T_19800800_S464]|uniref:Uncharacterized protein n=1 Tax=Microcystis aeruginosa Ma_SC_T_19800800_S464 TaxID=2486257 RepID=A0A552DQV1_MICAE|nr:MAG: hypothetical protein EWV81_13915 [Microcystis aeruginosa Ma_SC_T_19800800_S464]